MSETAFNAWRLTHPTAAAAVEALCVLWPFILIALAQTAKWASEEP